MYFGSSTFTSIRRYCHLTLFRTEKLIFITWETHSQAKFILVLRHVRLVMDSSIVVCQSYGVALAGIVAQIHSSKTLGSVMYHMYSSFERFLTSGLLWRCGGALVGASCWLGFDIKQEQILAHHCPLCGRRRFQPRSQSHISDVLQPRNFLGKLNLTWRALAFKRLQAGRLVIGVINPFQNYYSQPLLFHIVLLGR